MRRNPLYVFGDQSSVGVFNVPINSMILINDADGNGNSLTVQLVAKNGLTVGSTIADFLSDETNYEKPGQVGVIPVDEKGQPDGVATLDSTGKIPNTQLSPLAITDVFTAANETEQLALTAQEGDVCIRTDESKSYIHNGGTAGDMTDWQELLNPTDLVQSVNGATGNVVLTTADINEDTNLYYTDARADARIAAAAIGNLTDVDTAGSTNGQVLKFDGTNWVPGADSDTTYTAGTGLSLAGTTFTLDAHLDDLSDVDTISATTGQVLKYDGTGWVAADDADTDTTYTAGTGITLNGTEFSLSDEQYTTLEKTKLAGIEQNATADMTGAEIKTAYENEADTNAFTDAEKTKLAGIADGAEVNVQGDWNETDNTLDSFILNKPTDITDLTSHSITELSDVDTTTTPNNDDYLKWDGTVWTPSAPQTIAIDDLSDVDTTTAAPTTGQTLKFDGNNWVPADDTDTTYTAGTGLTLTGTEFVVSPAAAVADITDPTTATTEDVANKINELLASLRTAGLLSS